MPDFYVQTDKVSKVPGAWDCLRVKIFVRQNSEGNGTQIGEYERNYPSLFHTFCPFRQGEIWYALYSTDYTATRIMELPSCRDLGGEEPRGSGFCPVDYHVPYDKHLIEVGLAGSIGFVAGCIWGDDSSWKIQYLDLSQASSGRIARDERFGYIEMPSSIVRLRECLSFDSFVVGEESPCVDIAISQRFDIGTGRRLGNEP